MWEEHLKGQNIGLRQGRQAFDPARPSLLCVHGSGGRAENFLPQLAGLSGQVNVAAIDLPGHGQTPGPGCQVVSDYAAWLGDFLAAGPLRPVLLGHSLGGAVAMQLALERPHLLRGLILAGTGSRLKVLPAILEGLLNNFAPTVGMIVKYAYAPGADPRLIEQGTREMAQNDPQVIWGDFTACDGFDISHRLGEIRLPAWCIVGDQDNLTPLKYSQYLVKNIAGAGLTVIEQAGHMACLEKPAAFNEAVLDFMAGR
ncbi:MAG: alpha/beta hydrolase [Desulfarculus sp.]|nr:alpha/beta hydrolase [Desulfarculus sp.]